MEAVASNAPALLDGSVGTYFVGVTNGTHGVLVVPGVDAGGWELIKQTAQPVFLKQQSK